MICCQRLVAPLCLGVFLSGCGTGLIGPSNGGTPSDSKLADGKAHADGGSGRDGDTYDSDGLPGDTASSGDSAWPGDVNRGDPGSNGDSAGDTAQSGDPFLGDPQPGGDSAGDPDPSGMPCTRAEDCQPSAFCVCANATCSERVCNAIECNGCTYTSGGGGCGGGNIAAGEDPNNACSLACNGSGACQLADGQTCTADGQCELGHVCECVDANCSSRQCSDCSASWGVLQCDPANACEGIKTDACGRALDCSCGPQLLVSGLADPDVLKVSDDLYYLSGTKAPTRSFPIYTSTDLRSFEPQANPPAYNPSTADPSYDYCCLWAPDLSVDSSGLYTIFFSGQRVAKGAACGNPCHPVATFFATGSSPTSFGRPQLIANSYNQPRTIVGTGCPADGCDKAIRIDAAKFDDGSRTWLFYVWFENGNNISSFPFDNPSHVIHNSSPQEPFEGNINEGPELFERNGKYFLFLSVDGFRHDYEMHYVVANSVGDLTRARNLRRHSRAMTKANGDLVENHGHNVIVERHGEYYNVFHIGRFDDAGTQLLGRDTYLQRILFKDNQAIHTLNSVDVRWQRLAGYSYSLDIKPRGANWIGPCIPGLGTALSTTYAGMCRNAAQQQVDKSDIEAFRIFYSNDGVWDQWSTITYDGFSDEVSIPIPGGVTEKVALSWSELSTAAQYSLDVQLANGTWLAPCVGAAILDDTIAYVFGGTCLSGAANGQNVNLPTVQRFRICSAVGGDWAHATCGRSAAYDGQKQHVRIQLP